MNHMGAPGQRQVPTLEARPINLVANAAKGKAGRAFSSRLALGHPVGD
jgi:hypothetical protein